MTGDKIIKKTEFFIKETLKDINPDVHGYRHVDRVRKWILVIGRAEKKVDLHLLEMAALLHDVGMGEQEKKGSSHYIAGERIARNFLQSLGYYNNEDLERLCLAPRFHGPGHDDWLVKLLQDADKMELFGATAVARGFSHYSERPFYIDKGSFAGKNWTKDKIEKNIQKRPWENSVADNLNYNIDLAKQLHTKTAKRLAREQVAFMSNFVKQLKKETIGL